MLHNSRKRSFYLQLILVLLFTFLIYICMDLNRGLKLLEQENNPSPACAVEQRTVALVSDNRVVSNEAPEEDGERIFFLETSGRSYLKLREVCAVESAARMNPGKPIQVMLFTESANEHSAFVRILGSYSNVKVYVVNRDEYFAATPFEQWYREGLWKHSEHSVAHLSDFLRILTLWKGGGIYLDMDFVIMKQLIHLQNFSCTEGHGIASNGVIALRKDHPVLKQLITDMPLGYNPAKWSANGPGKLASVLKKVCGVKSIDDITPENCYGYNMLPPKYFYPVHYGQWKEYFTSRPFLPVNPLARFRDSYAIHVWNKFSFNTTVKVGSKQIYALAAARYCPLTFAEAATVF